jgi:hypothetical protein
MHFSPGLVPGAPRNVHPGTAIVKVYRAYRAFLQTRIQLEAWSACGIFIASEENRVAHPRKSFNLASP